MGHWKLHRDKIKQLKVCQEIDFIKWSSDAALEAEANAFAAELLLPDFLIKDKCDVRNVDFRPVTKLAEEFRTSLTATALRFVEMCPEACALVLSHAGKISWFKKNNDFYPRIKSAGSPLDKRSLTFDAFAEGKEVHTDPEEITAAAWVNDDREDSDTDIEFVEHVIPMPNLGAALTLLWLRA